MRARVVLVLVVAGCFPDADKLRNGAPPVNNPGTGGVIGVGGSTGTGGGMMAGTGGTPAGTGGSPAGTGGSPATGGQGGGGMVRNHAQLCAEFAAVSSEKASACSPFLQAFRYGTKEAQAARLRFNCGLFDLPYVQFPPAPFKPCADALAAQPCADWLDGQIPPACLGLGALPVGAGCSTSYQCQSDLCDLQANGCGKCAAEPGAGQPCYRGICAMGLVCNPAKTCVTPGGLGAACDDNAPCRDSLGCNGGKCAALGAAGAACTTNEQCDVYRGVVCGAMNTKCVPVTAGPMCKTNPDGSFMFCAASGTCNQMTGSCAPAAADGAACSDMTGPQCLWPASCAMDMKCRYFQPKTGCPTGAQRAPGPGPDLLPEDSVQALWRTLVPRSDTRKNF